jgi:hypothetical protein
LGGKLRFGLMCSACFAAAAPALAQVQQYEAPESNFARDRNVSVRERPRPDYQAGGINLGGFTALARTDVGIEYNDNIFATETGKIDDFIVNVSPSVNLRSNWSRNALNLFARGNHREFLDNGDESTTDVQGGANGYADAGSARLDYGVDYGRFAEPRTSTTAARAARSPIKYRVLNSYAGLTQEFNRLRLAGRVDYRKFNYRNGRDVTNAIVFQDDRDRDLLIASARADYAVTPDTAVFLAGTYNKRDYDLDPPFPGVTVNRDSDGIDVGAGASFDLSNLARGEVQVGYFRQEYEAPGFSNSNGLSVRALVEWFPTQLTTVTLTGNRGVEDAAIAGSPSFISTGASLQIDHELLRNLILTARGGYTDDDYRGIDRQDKRFLGYAGANFLFNRNLGLTLAYEYLDQSSSGAQALADYKVNRLMATVALQF